MCLGVVLGIVEFHNRMHLRYRFLKGSEYDDTQNSLQL
jgi:hypothetical protein